MPTQNPRLTITLQPSLAAQLRRMSELTGNSQSAMIAELLETSSPMFERLIVVLEAAQKVTASAKDARQQMAVTMASDMDKAQAQLEAQLGLQLDHFDLVTKPILDEAERVTRRSRKGAAGDMPEVGRGGAAQASSTPMSNRGVRSHKKTGQSSNENRGVKRGSI